MRCHCGCGGCAAFHLTLRNPNASCSYFFVPDRDMNAYKYASIRIKCRISLDHLLIIKKIKCVSVHRILVLDFKGVAVHTVTIFNSQSFHKCLGKTSFSHTETRCDWSNVRLATPFSLFSLHLHCSDEEKAP